MATAPAPHPGASFTGAPENRLLNPFRLHIDPMVRLLLVDLTGDLDRVYRGFEPQVFDDAVHGRGVIVLGWRRDQRCGRRGRGPERGGDGPERRGAPSVTLVAPTVPVADARIITAARSEPGAHLEEEPCQTP